MFYRRKSMATAGIFDLLGGFSRSSRTSVTRLFVSEFNPLETTKYLMKTFMRIQAEYTRQPGLASVRARDWRAFDRPGAAIDGTRRG
jgi:hypothetical protein